MAKVTSIKKKKVSLSFTGQPGKEVFVVGSFNDWTLNEEKPKKIRRLKEDSENPGNYSINMFLPMGEHEYKFFCDEEWFIDPTAAERKMNEFGTWNSILKVS